MRALLVVVFTAVALASRFCGFETDPSAEYDPVAEDADFTEPTLRAPTTAELLESCATSEMYFADFQAQLDAGEFAAVDAAGREMLDGYLANSACEAQLWNTVGYFVSLDREQLDRWVAARPDSWLALSARGSQAVNEGFARRGTKLARDTTEAQWAGMRDAFARAEADLERAVAIEPDAYVAHGELIRLRMADGSASDVLQQLAVLLERQPHNYGVRRRAVQALEPSWGGSIAAMRQVANEAQAYADTNPRLRILPGFAEAEVAAGHWRAERYAQAAKAYRRALAYGGWHDWYYWRAQMLEKIGAWDHIAEHVDAWIADMGEYAGPLVWRARVRWRREGAAAALADLDQVLEWDPNYVYALALRGSARRESGLLDGAEADLRRAVELRPDYAWPHRMLAEIVLADPERAGDAVAVARRFRQGVPGDVHAWLLLGTALHATGDPEARSVLEHYVRLASGDGSESGGIAKARQLLEPAADHEGVLPGLAWLGLASPPAAPEAPQ